MEQARFDLKKKKLIVTLTQFKTMTTLYQIVLTLARNPYQIGLLTNEIGDVGVVSV